MIRGVLMFIYVHTQELKDKLLSKGYKLIKASGQLYIFENKPDSQFDLKDEKGAVISNLMF